MRDKLQSGKMFFNFSENYDKAVAILKSRFGDPQIIIHTNMFYYHKRIENLVLTFVNFEKCLMLSKLHPIYCVPMTSILTIMAPY